MFWKTKDESTMLPLEGESGFNSQVEKFRAAHPQVPVYLVSVKKERPMSNFIAESTGIEHASPQIIVFRKGTPSAVATHGEITAQSIEQMIQA
ncbi:MAG: DUF2847 family protein [Acidobacteria bacterium]|nr:DUF2847 family protein [Acidobacteriota bacterium]